MERLQGLDEAELEDFRNNILREEFDLSPDISEPEVELAQIGVLYHRPSFRERLFSRVRENLSPYIKPALVGSLAGTLFILGMEWSISWPNLKPDYSSLIVGGLAGMIVGIWLRSESIRAKDIVVGS